MNDELSDQAANEFSESVLAECMDPKIAMIVGCREWRRRSIKTICEWMMANGYATGHGDSIEDLLRELDWQVKEREDQLRRRALSGL